MLLTPDTGFGLDPWAGLRSFQDDINRLFADSGRWAGATTYPPVNLWAGDDSVVVTAEVPGVSQDDLELSVRENVLTIQGRRTAAIAESDKGTWHHRERPEGAFSRLVELPFRVDPDKVQARCVNGVLEIEMQRPEAEKPRRIEIRGS